MGGPAICSNTCSDGGGARRFRCDRAGGPASLNRRNRRIVAFPRNSGTGQHISHSGSQRQCVTDLHRCRGVVKTDLSLRHGHRDRQRAYQHQGQQKGLDALYAILFISMASPLIQSLGGRAETPALPRFATAWKISFWWRPSRTIRGQSQIEQSNSSPPSQPQGSEPGFHLPRRYFPRCRK